MMNSIGEKLERARPYEAPAADGYRGDRYWLVRHPQDGAVMVRAPDRGSAIIVAARYWGRDVRKAEWREDADVMKGYRPAQIIG